VSLKHEPVIVGFAHGAIQPIAVRQPARNRCDIELRSLGHLYASHALGLQRLRDDE
jgi:hypothetical protein